MDVHSLCGFCSPKLWPQYVFVTSTNILYAFIILKLKSHCAFVDLCFCRTLLYFIHSEHCFIFIHSELVFLPNTFLFCSELNCQTFDRHLSNILMPQLLLKLKSHWME
ncbi:Ubiquitin carboxyl-terminal hydrolase [Zea mays]|uniref:Ubiquitin carboxyl-terminal hydrolase n=1 Tax=Zea mays TaxID=4577 RepID=A0A1D6F3S8_MAIZE|nr:Ubiquitin carboxyl-terminal hydrolase [Zea mays]